MATGSTHMQFNQRGIHAGRQRHTDDGRQNTASAHSNHLLDRSNTKPEQPRQPVVWNKRPHRKWENSEPRRKCKMMMRVNNTCSERTEEEAQAHKRINHTFTTALKTQLDLATAARLQGNHNNTVQNLGRSIAGNMFNHKAETKKLKVRLNA
ncbi:hypothetical protein NDU88_001593 [Pleurodeles waltl]|uniref:Uncharacterized protein n=1 Tax=Pleurodeles waltl TaxID=8319 RepID=A0AAV7QAC5_PLEWA|nr:hypothetical protein NDU88_001593 [Pleurodeles waltl]